MNLKEAFRYQNFLEDMLSCVKAYLQDPSFLFRVKKTHLHSKANANLKDIIEDVDPEDDFLIADVIEFGLYIIVEKNRLMHAVSMAKGKTSIDIDAEIGTNIMRRDFCDALKPLMRKRQKKRIERGDGYTFNSDGNQVPYYYDIEVEITENYKKDKVKMIFSDLMKSADNISNEIEMAMVNTNIPYEPLLDMNGTFEDNLECYITAATRPPF